MKEGISKITKYMNSLQSETNEKMSLFSAKIEVEGHILRVNNAMLTLQRNLDLLIDSVIHAQKGVLQPQIISQVTLMETLIKSVSAFPKDTTLPVPISKDSAHLLFRLYDLQVYIKKRYPWLRNCVTIGQQRKFQYIQVDSDTGPSGSNQVSLYRHR
jgi:hypothetical protein